MKLRIFLSFLLLLSMFACGSGDSDDESVDDEDEVSEYDDDEEEDDDDWDDEDDEDDDEEEEDGDVAELEGNEDVSDGEDDGFVDGDTGGSEEMASGVGINSGDVQTMTVSNGDTYMLLAFKIYGDYTKWRSIASLNRGKTVLAPGMTVRYYAPSQPFNWNPRGNPYLIRRGDTLGTISSKVYGDLSKWKAIWNNNRPMIKNPNLIFAGFTLYYLDRNEVVAML